MSAATQMREVVSRLPVRCFLAYAKIEDTDTIVFLHNHELTVLKPGTTIKLGEPMTGVYDHRDQQVAMLIGSDPERYVILSELEDAPLLLRLGYANQGPPVAHAHTLLAMAIELAKSSIGQETFALIDEQLRAELFNLISHLKERGEDWEEEWPK